MGSSCEQPEGLKKKGNTAYGDTVTYAFDVENRKIKFLP